ncbi:MAG: ABC transporter ATP-binding protein [Geminicoccaceae bacterium]|nr:ABC transporter ATP-binding protein [Geminicoccaceae bacterium]
MSEPVLRLAGLRRTFVQGGEILDILRGIDLDLMPGSTTALVGPSGSGKSTLLHCAGLLERPSSGEITIGGKACGRLSDSARTGLRRDTIGFVYQFHHLLPDFTALENVMMPRLLQGKGRSEARRDATALLERLGIGHRLTHRPARLSGGEQQRVAIARALVNRPAVLLADEPTGNLDPGTAEEVMQLLLEVCRETSAAAVIATHNHELADRMNRTLVLQAGVLTGPGMSPPQPA